MRLIDVDKLISDSDYWHIYHPHEEDSERVLRSLESAFIDVDTLDAYTKYNQLDINESLSFITNYYKVILRNINKQCRDIFTDKETNETKLLSDVNLNDMLYIKTDIEFNQKELEQCKQYIKKLKRILNKIIFQRKLYDLLERFRRHLWK